MEELDAGAISTTASGISYISGPYWVSTLTFGNTTLTNITGASNIFIAKLGNQLSTTISTITPSSNTILVFPNPSTSTFNFSGVTPGSTIQVYNVLGEMIYSSIANSDNYRVTLNSQAKGIYFYRVSENGNDIQQGKIVLE